MTTPPTHGGLGREKPDARDHLHDAPTVPLPGALNLVAWPWPVWDQEGLNSCTAHVVAGAVQFLEFKEGSQDPFEPSRLFIYFNERVLYDEIEDPQAHAIDHDLPVYMRDGIKAVARWGVCSEELWTDTGIYGKFVKPPPPAAYEFASQHKAIAYRRLDVADKPPAEKLRRFKTCLKEGYPFTLGIRLEADLRNAPHGAIPTPVPDDANHAGHALLVTGYDDGSARFLVRNSMGKGWGEEGYGTIGYDYVCDDRLADSFWTIRRIA